MTTACPDEAEIADLARGGPDGARRHELERHVDACDACGRLVAEFLRVFGSVDGISSAPRLESPSGEPTLAETTEPSGDGQRSPLLLRDGAKLGRYVVLKMVGAGGMGVVHGAYDPELDRKVALKLLQVDEAMSHEDTLSQRNRRLLREAQAMARLHHPNVVTVHDVGTFESRVFLAMEFVGGGTLREWTAAARRSWRETLAIFRQAGEGLAAAHAAGLVHRDFKPDNVLLGEDGRVVVTDFGLARPAGESPPRLSGGEVLATGQSTTWDETLTRTGALVGTPAYMSPEQLKGERAEAASDQFSFCVALYEALYRERPFAGDGLAALVASVLEGRVRPAPPDRDVPRWLRRVILRGLALDPAQRYADMQALLAALRPPSRPLQMAVGAIGLGAVGVVASILGPSRALTNYCDRTDELLLGVWDAEISAAVQDAFEGTNLAFAAQTSAAVIERVDDYARRWAELQVATCEAERAAQASAGLTALRMACLATRRDGLEAVAEVLQEADTTVVIRAPDLVEALEPLSHCEDAGVFASGPVPPPPTLASEVGAIRGLLARAAVMGAAGKPDAAAVHGEEALRRAEAIDYPPVRGEAMLRVAQMHQDAGDLDASEAAAHEALTLALANRHLVLVAEASHHLGHLALVRDRPSPHAERWATIGRAALGPGSGSHPLVDAQLQNILGTAQRRHGQLEESVATLERALSIFVEHFGDDDSRLAAPLATLGLSLARLGRHEEASLHLERARDLFAQKYGRNHLGYASALQNLGASSFMQGSYAHALELYQESLQPLEAVLGPRHPSVGVVAYSVASALLMLGRHDEALEMAHRARTIGTEVHGEPSVPVANDWSLIGEIHRRANAFADAETALRRALEGLEAAAPEERKRGAFYRSQLGATLARTGNLARAEELLTAALAEQEALLGSDDEYVAETLGWLADLHLDGHRDPAAARPLAERSLAIYERVPAPPQARAEAQFRLARVLTAESDGPTTRARSMAENAADTLRRSGGDPTVLATIDAWLHETRAPEPG